MNNIRRLTSKQAIINFGDSDIRIFIRYRRPYCSAIRVWKLQSRSSYLSMLKTSRLIWAVCGDEAKFLHGWFYRDGDLMKTLAGKVSQCKDFEELKGLLIDCERIIYGETPSSRLLNSFHDKHAD